MNYAKEKPVPEGSTLRMRRCCGRDCGVVFFVCIRCDRGQRYCSDACREAARRRQTRAANSRYQRSETGKQAHRLRQRAYRKRTLERRATYQGHTSAPPRPLWGPSSHPHAWFAATGQSGSIPIQHCPTASAGIPRHVEETGRRLVIFLRFLMVVNTRVWAFWLRSAGRCIPSLLTRVRLLPLNRLCGISPF